MQYRQVQGQERDARPETSLWFRRRHKLMKEETARQQQVTDLALRRDLAQAHIGLD